MKPPWPRPTGGSPGNTASQACGIRKSVDILVQARYSDCQEGPS
jgi:hypothetical protein